MTRTRTLPVTLWQKLMLYMQALEELNMSDNELERVPEQWSGLQALRTVWMYGNRLRALPADIFALPQLECEPPVELFLPTHVKFALQRDYAAALSSRIKCNGMLSSRGNVSRT